MHSHTVLQNQIYPETAATKSKKHSIFTHFPKDRDCDVCLWTKITRAPYKKLIGKAVLKAEKFGDLITADHKVLNEGSESRHNHRYTIVVQNRTTRWIQSYPCTTKSSHETEKSWSKVLEQSHRQLDGVWDGMWGFIMESPHFNTSHRSETTGIAERAVRRLKRRHFSSIATIRTGWKVVVRFFGMLLPSAKHLRPPRRWGKHRMKDDLENHSEDHNTFGALIESHPISTKDQTRVHQFGKKTLPRIFLGYTLIAGGIWKRDILVADMEMEDLEKFDASDFYPRRINAKEILIRQKDDEFIFPFVDGAGKLSETTNSENPL